MIRCRSLAEMPVRRVDISKIARNHTLSGLWVFSSSVPDVKLVWCPQSAHSNVVPSRIVHTRVELQRAHEGVPPHRASEVRWRWLKTLKRRSQKAFLRWPEFTRLTDCFFPQIKVLHPLPCHRFDARTRGRSPVR